MLTTDAIRTDHIRADHIRADDISTDDIRAASLAWEVPCVVCGDDADVCALPADEGFSPDERVCLRCGGALLVRPLWPSGQARSA